MSRSRLHAAGWAALVLLAALVPYRDLFSDRVPAGRDLLFYFYPIKAHLAEALRAGELPLVDRFRWGGAPLLGAPGAAAFYPANLLFVVLPLGAAMKAWILGHLALGVAGFAAFSRRLGLAPVWAWTAGLLFGLSGVTVSAATFCGMASAIAWIPWLAAGVLDVGRLPSPRTAARASLAAALLLLGSPPELVLHAAAISALLLLAPAEPRSGPREPVASLRARLGWAAAAAVVAAALAAPALAASFRAQSAGVREGGALNEEWAAVGSFPAARLPELALDFSVVDWTRVLRGPGIEGYPYFPSVTPGRAGFLLAIAGLLAAKRRSLAPVALALSGVLLALGPATPVWRGAIRVLPPLAGLRYPEKHLVLWGFGLAWLAALGLLALSERLSPRAARLVLPVLLVAVLVDRERTAHELMPMADASVLTKPPAILSPLVPPTAGLSSPPRLFHRDSLVPVPVYDVNDLFGSLRTGRETVAPSYASLFGVAYVFELDYDLTLPREAYEWLRLLSKAAAAENPVPRRIVRNAGAAAVLSSRLGEDARFHAVLEPVPEPVPPWRFVSRVVTDPEGLRLFGRMLGDGAPSDAAYVLGGPGPAERFAARGRVLGVTDRPSGLVLDVEVEGPSDGFLLLSRLKVAADVATVDRQAARVADAGFGFAGVSVPPGRHSVRVRPDTDWVRFPLVLSLIALGAVGIALVPRRRGRP